MKSRIFWVVTPCNSLTIRRFGGKYRLHLEKPSNKPAEGGVNISRSSFQAWTGLHEAGAWSLLLPVSCLGYSWIMKVWAIYSSETLESLRSTRRHKPEDRTLHGHRRENLKACMSIRACFMGCDVWNVNDGLMWPIRGNVKFSHKLIVSVCYCWKFRSITDNEKYLKTTSSHF
jgi:hypothetical protein